MRKIVIVLAMALMLMPVLSNAETAGSAAGKSAGNATAASVSTGTIVAASVGVAVVGALALSNGGSGSSSAVADDTGELSAESYAAVAEVLESLSDTEVAQLQTVLASAEEPEVAEMLDAVSAAVDAGLTAADIQEAASEAGIRRPAAGTPAGDAYDNLLASFRAVATTNPAAAASFGQMVSTMDDTKLGKIVSTLKSSKGTSGDYKALAATFKKDLADILEEVST
ncbi:MAG: hypothetical protein C0602_10595 [Denitrovibrio sp.]|nr:MAG: hypothetical protein C0602_10595 [Denitrovibrio sp.]